MSKEEVWRLSTAHISYPSANHCNKQLYGNHRVVLVIFLGKPQWRRVCGKMTGPHWSWEESFEGNTWWAWHLHQALWHPFHPLIISRMRRCWVEKHEPKRDGWTGPITSLKKMSVVPWTTCKQVLWARDTASWDGAAWVGPRGISGALTHHKKMNMAVMPVPRGWAGNQQLVRV